MIRFFKTQASLRTWLEKNHDEAAELNIGFYKKASGKPTVTYPEAVDEALCFGWIDGVRHSIDETRTDPLHAPKVTQPLEQDQHQARRRAQPEARPHAPGRPPRLRVTRQVPRHRLLARGRHGRTRRRRPARVQEAQGRVEKWRRSHPAIAAPRAGGSCPPSATRLAPAASPSSSKPPLPARNRLRSRLPPASCEHAKDPSLV